MKNRTIKIVLTALFSALVFVSTIVIQIPSPMDGYINLGDCFVLLSSWILGPSYGLLASFIGSGLADVLTGYAFYAPATIIIKGVMVLISYYTFKNKNNNKLYIYMILSGILAELFMVFGYFLYAALILGNGFSAILSVPGNLIQGLAGVISAVILYHIIKKLKLI